MGRSTKRFGSGVGGMAAAGGAGLVLGMVLDAQAKTGLRQQVRGLEEQLATSEQERRRASERAESAERAVVEARRISDQNATQVGRCNEQIQALRSENEKLKAEIAKLKGK